FNREAGGPGALIGIVWLVPFFGVYFCVQLARQGRGPKSRGRSLGFTIAGILVFFAISTAAQFHSPSQILTLVLFNVGAAAGAAVAYQGWPDLGLTNIAYGFSVRIPVAIIMLIAMIAQWGTHYELGPPGLPPLDLIPNWLLIGLMPQTVFWVSFTVMVGGLFGILALFFLKAPKPVHAV
ncbi:MAG: hypothetical protein HY646_16640, partial [Acidobacteria bacterium]|nr:hypothetical protein [Acidobacteriota bacterium]